MGKLLTNEELEALKSAGIIAENWYAVTYSLERMPFALFESKEIAEAYRHQFCRTALIEPWPMVKRDFRKPHSGWII